MKDPIQSLELPVELDKQFSGLRLRLLKVFSFQAVISVFGALVVSYILLWVSDRLWNTPKEFRIGLWGGFFFLSYTQWVIFQDKGLRQGNDYMRMAKTVQRKFKILGSRLSGILELSDPEKRPAGYSTDLYKAAIKQVSDEASGYDFESAVQTGSRIKLAQLFTAALGLFLLLVILFPKSIQPTFHRLLVPWSDSERFSMVEVDRLPERLYVPHGEEFEITGDVTFHSFWKPRVVDFSIRGAFEKSNSFSGNNFSFSVPGCIEKSDLLVTIGDASKSISVIPVYRPGLEDLEISINYPEYLGYEQTVNSGTSGFLSLLSGSDLQLSGKISREIKSAEIDSGSGRWTSLSTFTNQFDSPSYTLNTNTVFSVKWTDKYGFEATAPWQLNVEIFNDTPPTLSIRDIVPQGAYLETEIIPAVINAMDDFGIAETGLSWRQIQESNSDENKDIPSGSFSRKRDQFNSVAVEENFGFSPKLLGLPPDSVLEVRGYAKDYRPGSDPVYTEPIQLLIVSIDRHAELLRQNLENVLTQAEDILRAEENISELNKMALEDLALNTPLEDLKDQIEANADLQKLNAKDMERLAEMGQQLLREAMRNPAFKPQAIEDWNQTLQQMQSISQKQMPKTSQQMQQASSQPSQQEAKEELDKAQEMIDEILKDLEELQEDINQGLDDLQAMTLAQRLRAIGEKQMEIIDVLKTSVARTIGLNIEELSSKFVKSNKYAADDQTSLSQTTEELMQEIGRFAERTKLKPYEVVSKAMKEQSPAEALDGISNSINKNILAQAMTQQSDWADKFEEWAEVLEPKANDRDNSSQEDQKPPGEQEENQNKALMEMLINLLRMREKEIDIQLQTRLLNDGGVEKNEISEPAGRLSSEQLKLMAELDDMSQSNPIISLAPVMKEGSDLMLQVSTLLGEPRVDSATDLKQADTVNALTDAINIINEAVNNKPKPKSQKQQQAQQASAQQMAFLMQMMSQAPVPGQMPGTQGNPNGGDPPAGSPDSVTGNVAGNAPEERKVDRASGSLSEMPSEFRPMLEEYFKLLEKIQQ